MKTKKKAKAKISRKKPASKPGSSKTRKKKYIAAAFALGTAGIISYFGLQYFKRKKQTSTNADIDAALKQNNNLIDTPAIVPQPASPKITKPVSSNNSITKTGNDSFPLKKGSKGETVRQLQESLIAKYGKSMLPKYGADADFGSETVNALKKLGYPASIDESTFNVITAATRVDPSAVGKELYSAAKGRDYDSAITALRKLKSTEDYSNANEVFKSYKLLSPGHSTAVSQTIVNGLLNTFSTATQKDGIKKEFLRMNLKFDGNKWSLSGLDGVNSIITTEPTTIWVNAKETVKVPARMVLGNEVSRRLDYTLFENKGKYFLVNTKSVTYL